MGYLKPFCVVVSITLAPDLDPETDVLFLWPVVGLTGMATTPWASTIRSMICKLISFESNAESVCTYAFLTCALS